MNHKIYQGHVLDVLEKLPDEYVDMHMTSPPYYGLRDYDIESQIWGGKKNCQHEWGKHLQPKRQGSTDAKSSYERPSRTESQKLKNIESGFCKKCNAWYGQLGLEPTFGLYIQHLLQITNELKRVWKKTGSFYLNIGDTYGGSGGSTGHTPETKNLGRKTFEYGAYPSYAISPKEYAKSLLGIPWRLALRMIDEQGWILRNEIIWHKPNPMPSSVKDRLTNTHEKVFHFVKSQKYYYDLDAIRKLIEQSTIERYGRNFGSPTNKYNNQDPNTTGGAKIDLRPKELKGKRGLKTKSLNTDSQQLHGYDIVENLRGKNPGDVTRIDCYEATAKEKQQRGLSYQNKWDNPAGKNPGDFWDITTQAFKGAHFAVFPEELCRKPIESSCPKEICKKCGQARERISKKHYHNDTTISGRPAKGNDTKDRRKENAMNFSSGERTRLIVETTGWADCKCNAGFEPGIVLDPFAGSGTLSLVAEKLGRNSIAIEIKSDYVKMIEKRLKPYVSQDKLFEKKSTLEIINVSDI